MLQIELNLKQEKESLIQINESATAGATSSGNVATVVRNYKFKKNKSEYFNPDGTAKNALDADDNLMGGQLHRR